MHVIVEHQNGVITNVIVATVAGQLRRAVPVAADGERQAAYLQANAGKWVKQSDYEKNTQRFEQKLLLLMENRVVTLPINTLVIAVAKLAGGATLLLDLVQNWQSGKYCVIDDKIVFAPDWEEPTLLIAAAADPLAP